MTRAQILDEYSGSNVFIVWNEHDAALADDLADKFEENGTEVIWMCDEYDPVY